MIDRPSDSPTTRSPGLAPFREFTFAHGENLERVVLSLATSVALPSLETPGSGWLSERELARVARAVAKRRQEFMLGRYVAKTALAAWHRRDDLDAFTILPGAFDQPVVEEPGRAGVTLAHTADVAIALAHEGGHPMGVDVEYVDADRIEVLRTQVGRGEVPPTMPFREAEALFLLWSAKEALSKALRCGLTCPFEILAVAEVRADASGLCTGTFVNFGQYRFASWLGGGRAFALVGSRNAKLDTVLPEIVRFTREAGSPPV
jgi:4'-phosphopantetheinyl transferase